MADAGAILRFLRSTSVRLSLRFAGLYALVTALIFGLTYTFAEREVTDWVAEQLAEDAAGFSTLYTSDGLEAALLKLNGFAGFNFENYRIYLLQDADGRILAGNIAGVDWQGDRGYVPARAVHTLDQNHSDAAGYILQSVDLGQHRLTLGTSTYFLEELREVLGRGLVIGFILLLLAGLIAGVIVGRKTERRLTEISGTLKSVAQGQLDARVPAAGHDGDDLARVATEINRTITQLQHMVESQKQISADIAHDLRTPMQRLRQRLDAMAQSGRLSPQMEDEVAGAIEVIDDLIDTFHGLLRIAEIESGRRRERFTDIALSPLLARLEDAYGAVAEENGQILSLRITEPEATVHGDQQLLTQMIANLVENAMRHAPTDTRIVVSLSRDANGVSVEVADNGPGIPADEREKVLRRFYRLEKSRTTPGNGLGLSLVKAIADLHGATVTLADNGPGLRVAVRFGA